MEGSVRVLSWKAARLSGYYSVVYMISVQYARHILFWGCQLSKNNFRNSHCQRSSGFPSTLQKHECGKLAVIHRSVTPALMERDRSLIHEKYAYLGDYEYFNVAKQEVWVTFCEVLWKTG